MASSPPQEEQVFGGVAQTFQSAVSPTFLSAAFDAFDAFDQPVTEMDQRQMQAGKPALRQTGKSALR